MTTTCTPLRYPGGKSQLIPFILTMLRENNLLRHNYCEPFAGGAGIALYLIMNAHVEHVYLNDFDPAIYAFWKSIIEKSDELIELIETTNVTIDEWHNQRQIYLNSDKQDFLQLGFATLFLNRTNRSGIIKAGVIGGKEQSGMYKIDCRFNKVNLIEKVKKVFNCREKITLFNLDAVNFIDNALPNLASETLLNLDPPYFGKGQELYTNFYQPDDHIKLAKAISKINDKPWIVTYDNVDAISKLYNEYKQIKFDINYSAQNKRVGTELMVLSPNLRMPKDSVFLKSRIAA